MPTCKLLSFLFSQRRLLSGGGVVVCLSFGTMNSKDRLFLGDKLKETSFLNKLKFQKILSENGVYFLQENHYNHPSTIDPLVNGRPHILWKDLVHKDEC